VTWNNFLELRPERFTLDELNLAYQLRILVNWMHGASHDMPRQLKCNGRYQEKSGRKHGEVVEQLWSMLKVCVPKASQIN
jgi:hypothetical protein